MREQLEQRLKELKAEFEAGHKTLAEVEARQATLRETLLRISGAIQVLEEELAKSESAASASEGSEAEASEPGTQAPGRKLKGC